MAQDRETGSCSTGWREGDTRTRLERGNLAQNRKRVKDAKIGDASQAGGGGRERPRKASYVMTFAFIF